MVNKFRSSNYIVLHCSRFDWTTFSVISCECNFRRELDGHSRTFFPEVHHGHVGRSGTRRNFYRAHGSLRSLDRRQSRRFGSRVFYNRRCCTVHIADLVHCSRENGEFLFIELNRERIIVRIVVSLEPLSCTSVCRNFSTNDKNAAALLPIIPVIETPISLSMKKSKKKPACDYLQADLLWVSNANESSRYKNATSIDTCV